MAVTPLEWKWRRWRMRVGEFRGYTGPRPADLPQRIPAAWWIRLRAFQARVALAESQHNRAPLLTPTFNGRGALWRSSDSEDVQRAKQAGLRWALLRLGGDDWRILTGKLDRFGIPWGWWFHCRTVADLDRLLAESDGRPIAGINVEEELRTTLTPAVVRQRIDLAGYTGEPCMIGYGWIQNDVKVTDRDMGRVTWLLEMFPADAPYLMTPVQTWPQCQHHARALGIRYPAQLMQAYRGGSPDWYDRDAAPCAVYTADDANDEWERWLS